MTDRFCHLPAHVVNAWPGLTASEAKVIVPIAARMNRDGEAWPGRETVMAEAGISNTHTFAKAIDGLGKKGILKITHRPNKSHLYAWPDVPFDSTPGCATSPHNQTSGCATSRPLDVPPLSTRSIEDNTTRNAIAASEAELGKTQCQLLPAKLENPTPLPPAPRRARRGKPAADSADVEAILSAYGKLRPPSIDRSRSRARGHLEKLLRTHSVADLLTAVKNYGVATGDTAPRFRRAVGNFFGRDRDFESYLPGAYTSPADQASEAYYQRNKAAIDALEDQIALEAAQAASGEGSSTSALPASPACAGEPANAKFDDQDGYDGELGL